MNGYEDHVHCLISLKPEQNIARVIQLIKGESSFWINRNNLCSSKFEWQNEYFAMSVSDTDLTKIRNYIKSQEERHRNKRFLQECNELSVRQKLTQAIQ
jgi:REP element-mobilizing transposase RayT